MGNLEAILGYQGAQNDGEARVVGDEIIQIGAVRIVNNRLLKQDIVLESKPGFEPTTTMRMDLTPPRGKPSGHQAPRRKPAQPGHLKSHGMASQKPKSSSPGGSPRGRQRSPQR